MNKNILTGLFLMILATALYRIIPSRPFGFAPQIAVAIFAGALFNNNKKYAFLLPLISMLVSDGIFQILYLNGLSTIPGFYSGQLLNYILFIGLTCFGFFIKNNNIASITGASFAAPTTYFLLSNFLVWLGGGGYHHPKTMEGLMQTLTDGLPFYKGSLLATGLFSSIFFGTYFLAQQLSLSKQAAK